MPRCPPTSAGEDNGFALSAGHRLFRWGAGWEHLDPMGRMAPAEILLPGAASIAKIRTTSRLVVAIDEQGAAYSWGQNSHGECGQGLLPAGSPLCPAGLIEGIPRVLDAASGDDHLVLLTEAGLYTAGSDGFQQVGRLCTAEGLASVAPICPD